MNDIKNKKPSILNLSYSRQFYFPLTRILKSAAILLAITFFLFSFVYAPVYNSPSLTFAAQDAQAEQEKQQLEDQLAQLEKQISDYENAITQYQKQGQTLKSEINTLESKIAKLNLQIKSVNLNLEKIKQEIKDTQAKISSVERNINSDKNTLSQVLQNLYENENQNLMEIFLTNPRLSDFFGNLNNLALVQNNLQATLSRVVQLKNELLDQKEQLVLQKSDSEALKNYQASQKQTIQSTQAQKNEILKITKGKESEYQKLVTETKKTAAEIRQQILRLLGGGKMRFEEAYNLARFAEQATGVRTAFILAILTQESAISGVISANLGGCYYNTPSNNISGTVMKNDQKPAFLALMAELKLDPNTTPVSCPYRPDGDYGGAMGPAQFMPNTWSGYKAQVSAITGNNPASPFNNADAFVATALYLKNSLESSSCRNYAKEGNAAYPNLSVQFLQERCAAAQYYAGGNWYRFRFIYGDPVASQTQSFQKDINILNES